MPPRHQQQGLAYQVNHQGHRHPPMFSFLKQTKIEDKYSHIAAKSKELKAHSYTQVHSSLLKLERITISNKTTVCSRIKTSRGKNVQNYQLLQASCQSLLPAPALEKTCMTADYMKIDTLTSHLHGTAAA